MLFVSSLIAKPTLFVTNCQNRIPADVSYREGVGLVRFGDLFYKNTFCNSPCSFDFN